MKFNHYDLGYLQGGQTVEIKLYGNVANVRLMDSSNFSSYRAERRHRYIGGHATKSPVRLQIPNSGHWHVAIDLGGYGGSVKSSVRVLPGALPKFQERPLSSVPSLVQGPSGTTNPFLPNDEDIREYDVFISHASEDKDEIVRR
jgi:hypothetical protein